LLHRGVVRRIVCMCSEVAGECRSRNSIPLAPRKGIPQTGVMIYPGGVKSPHGSWAPRPPDALSTLERASLAWDFNPAVSQDSSQSNQSSGCGWLLLLLLLLLLALPDAHCLRGCSSPSNVGFLLGVSVCVCTCMFPNGYHPDINPVSDPSPRWNDCMMPSLQRKNKSQTVNSGCRS
jgi:hypothetical protein